MSAGKLLGAALGGFGLGCVAMQFMNGTDETSATDAKGSKLKKTLTNAGLMPDPPKPGSKLKSTPSGSMAVFSAGADSGAALNKGGGTAL